MPDNNVLNVPVRVGQVWEMNDNWGGPGSKMDLGSKFIIVSLDARADHLVVDHNSWVGDYRRGIKGERYYSDLYRIQFLDFITQACAYWIDNHAKLVGDISEHPRPARGLHLSGLAIGRED